MYTVKNSQGEIIAIATRKQDAEAMAHTVGTESPKKVDKEPR